jgi:hypothetical protein
MTMVTPLNPNDGAMTEEKEKEKVVVTPEKALLKAAEPSPDVAKSSIQFDEQEYEILCNRYLKERVRENESLPGGMTLRRQKKSRLLDQNISGYKQLGKEVDRLLKRGDRHRVFELLSQLRDFELNPRRVPPALKHISPASDEVAECVDLTTDREDECIDVERYIVDVLLRKEDEVCHPKRITVKVEPCSDLPEHNNSLPNLSGQKRYFDELDDGDESDDCSRFSQGCSAIDHDLQSEPDNSNGPKNDGVQIEPYAADEVSQGVGNIQGVEMSQQEIDEAKKEKTRHERMKLRKYGDRLLLARQCSIKHKDGTKELKGMLALGGGNQTSHMWYKNRVSIFLPQSTLKHLLTNTKFHLLLYAQQSNPSLFNDRFKFRYALAPDDDWNG